MEFYCADQPGWHFNLKTFLGIVYMNKKCPAIGDKQNKLWPYFMKEHLQSLDIRLLKFIYWHMKMPTSYYLAKKKKLQNSIYSVAPIS